VVQQTIKKRGRDNLIAEDVAPLGEAAVGGQDHGAFFVASVDQLEEQIAADGNDWQVADFIDDQEGGASEEPGTLAQGAFSLGLGERGDDLGEGCERDTLAGLYGLDGERGCEVALPGARWTEQMHDLGPKPQECCGR
jgi:hypothetical protein